VPASRFDARGREGGREEMLSSVLNWKKMFWEGKIVTEGKKERKCNIY